jgi:glycosyltransferase involved in cell wall biosynthesis
VTGPVRRDRLRILVVAPSRHPIREPHAGGLEALVWDRVRSLRASGHEVTLVAARGSDFLDRTPERMRLPQVVWGGGRSSDEAYPDGYLDQVASVLDAVVDELVTDPGAFDLIDNHSLHPVPIARAAEHGIPMLTTLHTPPLPELVQAADTAGAAHAFLAVSGHTAGEWRAHGVESTVLLNTVDPGAWPLGPGGRGLVWFGRIVPEKGPHLALDVARAMGLPLAVAGRVGDEQYFERSVRPRLGGGVRHLGPMRRRRLAHLVGRSGCALVTPRWDEPFGLVVAEALMTGTPVAAFDRGGISEVLAGLPGTRLVPPDDTAALAAAADELLRLPRAARPDARARAIERFSALRRSLQLEGLYRDRLDAEASTAVLP